MSIQATVILDSGCFLPMDANNNGAFTEIGYFESADDVPDIRVLVDGSEVFSSDQMNLDGNCTIAIRHIKSDGTIKTDGVTDAPGFHKQLLHMKDLYGEDILVDRAKFDYILRFDSGLFCAAMVKSRRFRKFDRQPDMQLSASANVEPKLSEKPILHNVHIHFRLEENEALEIAKDGAVLWSSRYVTVNGRIDIEIVADNTTAEKFYTMAFTDARASYWMPNNGDPPPMCSQPPCEPPGF